MPLVIGPPWIAENGSHAGDKISVIFQNNKKQTLNHQEFIHQEAIWSPSAVIGQRFFGNMEGKQ